MFPASALNGNPIRRRTVLESVCSAVEKIIIVLSQMYINFRSLEQRGVVYTTKVKLLFFCRKSCRQFDPLLISPPRGDPTFPIDFLNLPEKTSAGKSIFRSFLEPSTMNGTQKNFFINFYFISIQWRRGLVG